MLSSRSPGIQWVISKENYPNIEIGLLDTLRDPLGTESLHFFHPTPQLWVNVGKYYATLMFLRRGEYDMWRSPPHLSLPLVYRFSVTRVIKFWSTIQKAITWQNKISKRLLYLLHCLHLHSPPIANPLFGVRVKNSWKSSCDAPLSSYWCVITVGLLIISSLYYRCQLQNISQIIL